MTDVTQILSRLESGDPSAAEQLLPLVYNELRRLAGQKMARESPDHALQATELVHEAYLRIVDVDNAQQWDSRGHFYIAAGEAMRRILVDNARHKKTAKCGGGLNRVEFQDEIAAGDEGSLDILALDEALGQLETEEPDLAALVKLRFFAGLSMEQVARTLGISSRTAFRDWSYARALLRRELDSEAP